MTEIIHVNQVRLITFQLWIDYPRPFIDTSTISLHSQAFGSLFAFRSLDLAGMFQ